MFKSLSVAFATIAASSAFVFPIHFQAAVECSKDSSCTYATIQPGEARHDQAAATAKAAFDRVLADYEAMYR